MILISYQWWSASTLSCNFRLKCEVKCKYLLIDTNSKVTIANSTDGSCQGAIDFRVTFSKSLYFYSHKKSHSLSRISEKAHITTKSQKTESDKYSASGVSAFSINLFISFNSSRTKIMMTAIKKRQLSWRWLLTAK